VIVEIPYSGEFSEAMRVGSESLVGFPRERRY
jgi:hypothetical protein